MNGSSFNLLAFNASLGSGHSFSLFATADPFGAVLIASTNPFAAADPFAAKLLSSTEFAGVDAQKAEHP